jgi:hypothetical protein
MEFLISVAGRITGRDRQRLLVAGRRKQEEALPQQTSKWQVTLSNGVIVEFIGLCENPSGGKAWWGPDGSPLESAPYINYEVYGPESEDRTIYEVAWRTDLPMQAQSATRITMEGAVGSYSHAIYDRYGTSICDGLSAEGFAFENSRKKTTLRLGVKGKNGQFVWTTFKNISLVPGQDMGFEIVSGNDELK